MKKAVLTILALLLTAVVFLAGRSCGVYHAVMDSRIYDPLNDHDGETVFLELDGEIWVYEMG